MFAGDQYALGTGRTSQSTSSTLSRCVEGITYTNVLSTQTLPFNLPTGRDSNSGMQELGVSYNRYWRGSFGFREMDMCNPAR
jgi:hypothetical protein